MLKIFDKDHNAIGHIVKYKDCKIESEVATGDKTLSFVYLGKDHGLANEMYIQTQDDEYVIKEVPAVSGSFPQIVAILNLEDLQKNMWQTFSIKDTTIDAAIRTVLAGTGWTIGYCDVTKKRNAGMLQVSTLDVIQKLCTAFMCEPVFDTINKTVSFYTRRGEDKGMYFMSGLNLKKIQKKSTSYDYYTRIIPIGQEGLTIETVNDGKNYLENYQYSSKVLTYIWKDESYTDPQALMEDAQLKLEDLSKPIVAYSVDVRDLAAQKEEYSILSYAEGDTVKIIDQETGTMVSQRIKKLVRYPDNPEKNTCEIANTFLTFEEMQKKYQAAADIINYTVAGDGRYTGTINVSDILKFEEGLAGSSTIGGINSTISSMDGEIALVKLTVGEIRSNYVTAEQLSAGYATINQLETVNAYVHSFDGKYATIEDLNAKTVTAEEIQSAVIDAGFITADNADLRYASITLANVDTANIGTLFARVGLLTDMTVVDGYITGELNSVRINADVITAGTLAVERLLITGEDSIVYQINAQSSGLTAAELTDDIYKTYVNGSVIVAESITGDRIAATTITGNHIIAGSITGNEIAANTITANKIDVTDLFARDITAKCTITGLTLKGVKGEIGGWSLDDNCLYSTYTDTDGVISTVVLQNTMDAKLFANSYVSYENCTATIQGKYIYVTPIETSPARVRITTPLKPGRTDMHVYSGYTAKYDDITPGIEIYYIDENGDENFEWLEFAEEWGGTIFDIVDGAYDNPFAVAEINFPIDIPEGATKAELRITHYMPQAKADETYVFKTTLNYEGVFYETFPILSAAGVTIDKFLAVKKEIDGNVHIPFYVTCDGYLYTENAHITGNSTFSGQLLISDDTGRVTEINAEGNIIMTDSVVDYSRSPLYVQLNHQHYRTTLNAYGLSTMFDMNDNFTTPEQSVAVNSSGIQMTYADKTWQMLMNPDGSANVTGNLTVSGVVQADLEFMTQRGGTSAVRYAFGSGSGTGSTDYFGFYSYSTGILATLQSSTKIFKAYGEVQSTSANAFRAVYGNYGFIIRNDGSATYLMTTKSGDPYGSWNKYITIANSDCKTTFPSDVDISGMLKVSGDTSLRFPIGAGTQTANPSVQLRKSGNAGSYTLSLVYYNADGGTTYNNLINADGSRNWVPVAGGTFTGNVTVNGNFVTSASGATDKYLTAYNGSRKGHFGVSSAYNLGIYDGTNGAWIIYSDTSRITRVVAPSFILLQANGFALRVGEGVNGASYKVLMPVTTANAASNDVVYLGVPSARWKYIYSASSVNVSSDERDKNITELDERYLNAFHKLNVITYRWKNDPEKLHIGFSAQAVKRAMNTHGIDTTDMGAICHDFWTDEETGEEKERYSLCYEEITLLTVPVVQKHSVTLTEHAAKLVNIESQLESMKVELDEAHIRIKQLEKLINM